ncbi:hypothetical protein [Pseudoalteromonas sp. SR41-4]|uniref:hypothetical protein n=1 Tax=Pseudoalteromonas sp. SR41-4 TaxID=2760950 RepID=UPI0016016AA8|nr:hypothetical protein [Pseudoalteromonas sp. SR41-4]MBB1291490.1 hypothetical protein [Pseudoalteromonas sp. SR41-4]
MQNNDYLAVDIMPKKTRFNCFFYPHKIKERYKKFKGLCYLYNWIDTDMHLVETQPQRYRSFKCGNDPIKTLFFGPMAIGFTLSLLFVISCVVATYSDEPYQWWVPLLTFSWNLFFLNVLPVTFRFTSKKIIYFDRLKQTVGFTFNIPDCEQRDELGNCCFSWDEIVCRLDIASTRPGVVSYFPSISHIDLEKYPKTKMLGTVADNGETPAYCYLYWESNVRFMDLTKPLPDVPEYEEHRHLDPRTAEFDIQNNRPVGFWLDFSFSQQQEIWRKLKEEACDFDWLEGKPNEEITKPWLHFKGEPERIEKLTWKYKAKRLALQLFMGIP